MLVTLSRGPRSRSPITSPACFINAASDLTFSAQLLHLGGRIITWKSSSLSPLPKLRNVQYCKPLSTKAERPSSHLEQTTVESVTQHTRKQSTVNESQQKQQTTGLEPLMLQTRKSENRDYKLNHKNKQQEAIKNNQIAF